MVYKDTYDTPLDTIYHYKYYYVTRWYASLNASRLYNDGQGFDIIEIPFPNTFDQIFSFYLTWYTDRLSFTTIGFWHEFEDHWRWSTGFLTYDTTTFANTKILVSSSQIVFYSNSQIDGFNNLNKNGNCLLRMYVM